MGELNALPPDAVEAAAEAMELSGVRSANYGYWSDSEFAQKVATAALLAAQPAWQAWLREKVAQEIEHLPIQNTAADLRLLAARSVREGGTP